MSHFVENGKYYKEEIEMRWSRSRRAIRDFVEWNSKRNTQYRKSGCCTAWM